MSIKGRVVPSASISGRVYGGPIAPTSIKAKSVSIFKTTKVEDLTDVSITDIEDESILIYDSSLSKFKNVKLADALPVTSMHNQEVVTRAAGSNTNFPLEHAPIPESLMVFIDGVYQNQTFYSIINTDTVQFTFEVDENSSVTAIYEYEIQ